MTLPGFSPAASYNKTKQPSCKNAFLPPPACPARIALPGDKSISHRYAMIAAIAEGATRIHNYSTGADCHSTLGCMRALGDRDRRRAARNSSIHGRGLDGLRAPAADLDAGNSGSTIRMLSGILAAQPFRTRIFGDESLSRRPMQRIMKPLARNGRAHPRARGQVSAARNRGRQAARRSITSCRCRARR